MIIEINIMNNNELKNNIETIEIKEFPISFNPSEILDDVTGSVTAAVSLYIKAINSILIIGIAIVSTNIIIPNMPTTLFIQPIHCKNNPMVSDVKLPTIGIKLLSENLVVLINIPSEVSVNNPCIEIIPVNITTKRLTSPTEKLRNNFDNLFT